MVSQNAALFFMHASTTLMPDKRLIANQSTSPIKTINAWLLYFDVLYGGTIADRRNGTPGANLLTGAAFWVGESPSGVGWAELQPLDMVIYVNSDDYDILPSVELDVQAGSAGVGTWLVFQRQIIGSPAPNAHHRPMWFDQFDQSNSDKWKGYINGPPASADREFTTS